LATEQFVRRFVQQFADQIPERHRAGTERTDDRAAIGLIEIDYVSANQLRDRIAIGSAVAYRLHTGIRIQPQHLVATAVTVNVLLSIAPSDLGTLAGEVKPDSAHDAHIRRQLGCTDGCACTQGGQASALNKLSAMHFLRLEQVESHG
jgi:hypothetical protein